MGFPPHLIKFLFAKKLVQKIGTKNWHKKQNIRLA